MVEEHELKWEAGKNTHENIIIIIDGCYNHCTEKILNKDGIKANKYLNLYKDFKIPKIGPFKPFDYSNEDKERAIEAIIKSCEV